MNKKVLRKWAKNKRKELDMVALSDILVKKLAQSREYKIAKNIMIYYPLAEEVNLLLLLNDNTKTFYLPRISGKDLECCMYRKGDELCESYYQTKEPTCAACNKTNINLVIVPALACDRQGFRLGYGGGFYDRFLADYEGIKICCIPSELCVNTVYPEDFDVKMDLIITELFST